ncbi:E3 SUMO-protein ligase pli1 [Dimargaris xerosporica]|nr:E3 SUMO-protein ligase pli1 [Dimargaris xerosporica]
MAQPQIDDNKVVELMLQGRKVQELVSIIRQAQASIIFPTVSALRRTGRKNQLISQLVKLYVDMQASGNETNLRAFKSLLEKECSMTIARAHHIYYHYCVENSIQPPPQALQRAMTTHSADPALAARSSPAFTTAPQVFSNFPSNSGGSQPSPYQGLRFQPTPFYSVLQTLSNVITLNENWGRQSVASLRFKLDPAKTTATSYGQANTSAPICPCLLVTSSENALLSYQPNHPGVSAEYPRLYSIKVDGRFIGQNIIVRHSLKSKQTNPIDLSSFLHPNVFDHWLDVSYTASKKMVAVVVGIQTFTVDELLDRLCRDRFVAKDQIVEQLQGKDGDDEISTTTNVISLTCPLSYIRIEHPCRSNRCNHLQCFDAKSYLQMNELTPTWMCPICSQPADFDGLMIDGYSQDIVKQIPITETQVYVDSDFKWQLPSTAEAVAIGAGEADDDCDVEIKSLDLTSDDGPSVATPAKRKAHALSPSQGTPQRGSKTARVQIIDLTLSDSDELTAPSEHVPPPLPPQSTRAMATTVDTARPSLPVIDQAAYADAFGLPGPPAFAMPHPTLPPIAANPRPTSPLTPLPYGSVSDTPWWRPMNSPRPSSLSSPTVSFSSSPIIPQSPTSGNT